MGLARGVKCALNVQGFEGLCWRGDRALRSAIFDKATGERLKVGISSGKLRADGLSYRALAQIRKWERKGLYAPGQLATTTLEQLPNRARALDWEASTADFFVRLNGGRPMPHHVRP